MDAPPDGRAGRSGLLGARPNANGSGVDAVDPWPSGESSPGVGPGAPPGGSISIQHQMQQRLWSSSRAGLGETGDALVVSRGSTAGASPRRRPELIPRSRATLLKAARGGSARAPQSASGPFKISIHIGPADGSVSIFGYESRRRDSRRTTRRTGRSGFVGAMSGLLSLIRRCASSLYPGPTHRHPTHGTRQLRGPPMTKPKPGLYPSIPPPPHRRPR